VIVRFSRGNPRELVSDKDDIGAQVVRTYTGPFLHNAGPFYAQAASRFVTVENIQTD
jgi:hypothetical protein